MPAENPQPPSSARPSKLVRFRRLLFYLALLTALISFTAYLWPIDRDNLIKIIGPEGKWGFINTGGRVVTEPRWDHLEEFDEEGMARVILDGKVGWIDKHGNTLIDLVWDATPASTEDIVHDPYYHFNRHGVCMVLKDDRPGWINRSGEIVFPPDRNHGSWISFGASGTVRVYKGNKAGRMNAMSEMVIPLNWDWVGQIDEDGFAMVKEGGKFGMVDIHGDIVIPAKWDLIRPESTDPSANITVDTGSWDGIPDHYFDAAGMVPVMRDSLWGCVDKSGNVVVPVKFDRPLYFDSKEMAIFRHDDKVGWINRDGDVVIDAVWDYADAFNEHGLAQVKRKNKWGWIDRKGNTITDVNWDFLKPFDQQGFAAVKKNGKWGWMDLNGMVVIEPAWDWVKDFDSKGIARVRIGKLEGFVNRQGEQVVPVVWDDASDFDEEGLAFVCKDGKYGAIDRRGEIKVPLEWDWIWGFDQKGMALAEKDGKWGWIDRYGQVIIPAQYDRVPLVPSHRILDSQPLEIFDSQGMARVKVNKRYQWINRRGELIIKGDYLYTVLPFDENDLSLVEDASEPYTGKSAFVDRRGNKVFSLPQGNGWKWRIPFDQFRFYPHIVGKLPAYLATTDQSKRSKLQMLFLRIVNWFTSNEKTISDVETACVAYSPEGEIIWDSRWIGFERTCLALFVASLLVASLTGLFDFLKRR